METFYYEIEKSRKSLYFDEKYECVYFMETFLSTYDLILKIKQFTNDEECGL